MYVKKNDLAIRKMAASNRKTASRGGLPLMGRSGGKSRRLFAGLGRCRDRRGLCALEYRVAAGGTNVEHGQANRREHKDDRRPSGEPRQYVGRGARTKGGLRTLAAEGACQVGRTALLEENNADQEEAHNHVQDDDEVERNLHFLSCFPCLANCCRQEYLWCGRGDLNPYAFWAPAPQAGASANFATSARE